MVDLDPLQVTVFVNENNIVQLKKGDKAELTFANGEKREGILSFIAPAADEESRTFQVDVDLANDDNAIPAGLTTQVQIDGTSQKAHSISPAILTLDDTGAVGVKIVDENNIVRYIPVHIIADKSDKMWVTGLPDSANIITVGQDFVADGQQVNPVMVEQ